MRLFWLMIGVPFRAILALILTLVMLIVDCFCVPLGIIFFGEPTFLSALALPGLWRWVLLTEGFE
jgi:hypothetical protein